MPEIENKNRLTEIIPLLADATKRDSLPWEGTPDEDEFRSELSSGQVRLTRISSVPLGYYSALSTEERYSLALMDQSGKVIDSFAPTGAEEVKALAELFGMVRRRVLHLEHSYEYLLKELKNRAGQ